MKILHYIPTYAPAWNWGGPVRSVSSLCEELVRRGHDVSVLTTDAGLRPDDIPARGTEVLRNGVKVVYYPRVPGFGIKSPGLEKAVHKRAGEFDLVHVTAIWQRTGPAACAAARRAGVPYVISPRGALGPYSWHRGALKKIAYYLLRERAGLQAAAGFHYTSAMEAEECERFRFGRPSCVVPNGVDPGDWHQDAGAGRSWRDRHGICQDETVLLYAGRLHHKKGLELLPAALARLSGPSWRMVFIGPDDDGTKERLEKAFGKANLEDRVLFLPAVMPTELRAAYSGANTFLLPSLHENFGNVAVEAAACGCWILAADTVGVARELATLGVGECLPRDARAWADALAGAQEQPKANPEYRPARIFDLKIAAEAMDAFYQTLCADRIQK